MNREQNNLIRRKVYAFKKFWLKVVKQEATPRVLVYYRRGLKQRIADLNSTEHRPCIAGERYFLDAMKIDRKNFPTWEDLDDCLSAFIKGYSTDPK